MKHWKHWAVLAAVLVLTALAGCGESAPEPTALRAAVYPEMAPYPDETAYVKADGSVDDDGFMAAYKAWWEDSRSREPYRAAADGAADAFLAASLPDFLGGEDGENRVYSPLNFYLALGMLAETTAGATQAQILEVLDCPDVETLRTRASALWNVNYRADGATALTLASSLWLDEDVAFRQETLDALAEHYYASTYQGQMGSAALNEALQAWLRDQTGGLLETADVELDSETLLALAATIYFQAKWSEEFSESRTNSGTFHGAAGDTECKFMHQSNSQTYYWGEDFAAICRGLRSGGEMWFLLPDQGVSPEELLTSGAAAEFLLAEGDWPQSKFLIVNQTVPKFDISARTDAIAPLKALGVTEVFESGKGDFSPLMEQAEGVFVSQVRHDARVSIDEEGVTAAAYTVIAEAGAAAPPEEEVDFVLDRPFLFAITGTDGTVLFAGTVNQI